MSGNLKDKKLGIIHAAAFTVQVVEKFTKEIIPEVTICHVADDTIQMGNNAAEVGTCPKTNYAKFVQYAHNLEEFGVDLIMLACSTFNRAVEFARPMVNTPMLQIDRAMMDNAVKTGKRVGLVATLPTTIPSSRRLIEQAAAEAKKEVDIHELLCSEAFVALRAGQPEKHNELLLAAIDKLSNEVDSIVLAQVSMTALEPYLTKTKVPVFNSGRTGFTRAKEMLLAM
ncbi:MAG TPA: aspartate/glutamate racemase family protein [Pirellulales bacterium]|jgi:aspartate/glutamate racemase